MISIISSNVYQGFNHIEFMLWNLSEQTFQDFELIITDAFYEDNKQRVHELASMIGLRDVIHVPACEDKHIGRTLHWELFNNQLLFSNCQWVLNYGVYRYMHPEALAVIADNAATGVCTVLYQNAGGLFNEFLEGRRPDIIMDARTEPLNYLSNSGFFCIDRDVLIHQLNGHNEVLSDHWVDCDISERARKIPLNVQLMTRAFLRLERTIDQRWQVQNAQRTGNASGIGKPVCDITQNPLCVRYLLNKRQSIHRLDEPVQRVMHTGFEWVRCAECGTMGVEDSFAYMAYITAGSTTRAPVNVAGVGRNLEIVAADLKGKSLSEKVDIISYSHDNPRYLQCDNC